VAGLGPRVARGISRRSPPGRERGRMAIDDTERAKTTAAACVRASCRGCSLQGRVLCLHEPVDLMDFAVLWLTWMLPFLAGMILGRFWLALAVWVALAAVFFIYVEALVLCRHCPHYAEPGRVLSCHANSGLPKIPRIRPGPMTLLEKVVWLGYVAVLVLYYVPFFVVSGQWLLLGLTTWAGIAFTWTLQRTQCNRCYNLACPVNRVPAAVRAEIERNFPGFAPHRGR